jgi:hypothetical protein
MTAIIERYRHWKRIASTTNDPAVCQRAKLAMRGIKLHAIRSNNVLRTAP